MKESKNIKKVIESYPDYLVIDIHEILVAFQGKNQEETERLISNIYRTDFGKIVLTTTDYIKHNRLEDIHKVRVDELNKQGYSKGAIDILAGILTCGFDKELNWDALDVFSKKYFAMSDGEKERIKQENRNESKKSMKYFFKEIFQIIVYISFVVSAISFVFYLSTVVEHWNSFLGWIVQMVAIIPLLFVQFFLFVRLFGKKK